MIIDSLPNLPSGAQGTDELAIERGTTVYKVSQDTLKANLGLGSAAQNFRFLATTGQNQAFGIRAIVSNANYPARDGHSFTLVPLESGILLYDDTNSEQVLTINDAWIHAADTDFTDWNDFAPKGSSPSFRVGRTSNGSGTNTPVTVSNATWYGICFGISTYYAQMAILVSGGTADQRGRIYTRNNINGTWSAWRPVQMAGGGWLADGTDLDDMIYPGSYGLSAANTYPNKPTGFSGGIMTVVAPTPGGTYCIQRLETSGAIYVRSRGASSGTAFGSWYKFTGEVVS